MPEAWKAAVLPLHHTRVAPNNVPVYWRFVNPFFVLCDLLANCFGLKPVKSSP